MGSCISKVRHDTKGDGSPGTLDHHGPSGKGLKQVWKSTTDLRAAHGSTHQAQSMLGRGAEAETWLCRDLSHGGKVAVKLFPRPLDPGVVQQVVQGIAIQAELGEGCANIVTMHSVCLTPEHLAVVMDVALGGSVTSYVADQYSHAQKHGLFLKEATARYYFRQFISTVAFCHKHNIAHRDLKLDNALLDTAKPPRILLTDFGFAARWRPGQQPLMSGHLGTLVYSAPELLHDAAYEATAVDVWASGVLLVVSLLGAFPWDVPNQGQGNPKQESDQIWREEVGTPWKETSAIKDNVHLLSRECCDLLDKIFVVDPAKRIKIPEIMQHPFYQQYLSDSNKAAWEKLVTEQQRLDQWRASTPIDPQRSIARQQKLEALVREATKTGRNAFSRGAVMRPLQMLRLEGDDVESFSLRRESVAAVNGAAGRTSLELAA